MKRLYMVEFSAEVEIDDAVFDSALTDEWRGDFHDFHERYQVAEHIAFNLVRGSTLSQLDGFADQQDSGAALLDFYPDNAWELKK